MRSAAIVLLALLSTDPPAAPAVKAPASPVAPFGSAWQALVGDWTAEGEGTPGAGSGAASFRFDLGGNVLVRRSSSDTPAADGRPAAHHEDLLVFSPAPSRDQASAVYFDNEGHVIRYSAAWSPDGRVLTMVSVDAADTPRYRLTYTVLTPDRTSVSFEIAPPGSTAYRRYVGGVMHRAPAR